MGRIKNVFKNMSIADKLIVVTKEPEVMCEKIIKEENRWDMYILKEQ